jgi:hypothetical protein
LLLSLPLLLLLLPLPLPLLLLTSSRLEPFESSSLLACSPLLRALAKLLAVAGSFD